MKRILIALILPCLCALSASAQTLQPVEDVNKVVDNTPDSINKALMSRPAPGTTRKGDNPVLFLIGNSTMRNGTRGDGRNGQWGWGFFARNFFDESRITVENQALGGMSTRTFYNQLWPAIRQALRPGDWVIVSIGHNDNGPFDSGRARACIQGIGNDSLPVTIKETGVEETVYSYGGYMRRYISEIRRAGATPILMSLTPRNAYGEDGRIVRKPHGEWLRQVAEAEGVPYIDLNEISGAKLDSYGKWKTDYHFHGDKIHTSKFGAEMNARSAAEGIAANSHPLLAPLQSMMKNVALATVSVERQEGKPVVFITGDSTVKNADSDEDGMWGWGALAHSIFDENRITCVNVAKAGRSARTYLNEGRWEQVYNSLQPGDYVLIQFGHNDTGPIDTHKKRAAIATGLDSMHVYRMADTKRYELVYSFGWYLKKFIQDVREKGATPILLSLTPRNKWKDGRIERRNDSYGKWYREVVAATGVEFVDVHNITADSIEKDCLSKDYSPTDSTSGDATLKERASKFYNRDHTHTSKQGALLNARSVAKGLKEIGSTLADYLK